ncbi:MAG: GatB/YqeY domain-containing protein [Gemmatimonadetes bacterium]|nr:GatB/YqeY domain-containing protein [Gemmatimonadota bacterium]
MAARLQGELNAARKAQEKARVLLLGTVLSEIKNREIELGRDLTDEDVVEVIRKAIKRRRESTEMYTKAGRTELAAVESAEAQALEVWLPAAPSDDEVRAAVREAIAGGATAIGAVMGKVMPRFKGRLDGSVINRIAREELGTPA